MIPASVPAETFKQFQFQNRRNRMILWIALTAVIIQFVVFKWFYPYPNFLHKDSFIYMDIAHYNDPISSYPIGYPRFIRFFSVLTSSDLLLTGFQYLLLQGSALFMLFTLFYFFRPGKVVQLLLIGFMVLNPLFLVLANTISSDAYFLALSLAWFGLLLWIIHRPDTWFIVFHTIVLLLAFMTRYNALVYPTVAIIAFLLSRQPLMKKLTGIGAIVVVCGAFVLYTGCKFKELTGTWQYTPAGSWLLADNAVRTYRWVDSAARKPVPIKFKELDNTIRKYFDSSRHSDSKLPMDLTLFMYPPDLFLKTYRDLRFKKDTVSSDLKKWAIVAPLYRDYSFYIIRQYPKQYVQHYLWPGIGRYFAPPVEKLATYNAGVDTITATAKDWFGYSSNKVNTRTRNKLVTILNSCPVFSGVMNVMMLCSLVCFVIAGGFRKERQLRNAVLLAVTLWLLYAVLTIFTVWANIRLTAFPLLLTVIFNLLLTDRLWHMGMRAEQQIELATSRAVFTTAEA